MMRLDGALAVGNAFGDDDAGQRVLLDVGIEAFGTATGKSGSRDRFASRTSGGM